MSRKNKKDRKGLLKRIGPWLKARNWKEISVEGSIFGVGGATTLLLLPAGAPALVPVLVVTGVGVQVAKHFFARSDKKQRVAKNNGIDDTVAELRKIRAILSVGLIAFLLYSVVQITVALARLIIKIFEIQTQSFSFLSEIVLVVLLGFVAVIVVNTLTAHPR